MKTKTIKGLKKLQRRRLNRAKRQPTTTVVKMRDPHQTPPIIYRSRWDR